MVKKVVRYQSSNTGKVQAFEDMNWKHFIAAYIKLEYEYDLVNLRYYKAYSQAYLIKAVLEGQAAERELLSRDWSANNDLKQLEEEYKELGKQVKEKKKLIESLKAE